MAVKLLVHLESQTKLQYFKNIHLNLSKTYKHTLDES